MMTKFNLPKLWLYITFSLVLSLFALVLISCSQDVEDNEYHETTTTATDNKQNPSKTEYLITFAPGSFAEGAKYIVEKEASKSVILETVDFKRDGFTLVGWQEDEGAEQYYPIGHEFTEDRSVTLYPVWRISTYDIIFSPGEHGLGTPTKASKIHATPFVLPNQVFAREGHTQIGWSVVDGGEQVFGLSGEYLDNKPITLYPVWQKNTYTVTVTHGKDVVGEDRISTLLYGATYKTPAAVYSRNDYELIGWATEEGGALRYRLSEEIIVTGNMTLYPVWELTKTYSITPDYKKLPKTLMTTMSVTDLALYYRLVNAYLAYETGVSFTSDTDPALVLEILQCYFPVMYADISENGPRINQAEHTIYFDYLSSDADDHNKRIEAFTRASEKYLSGFNRTDTDAERALLIYSRLLQELAYDTDLDLYPYDANEMMQSAYYAVMYGAGRSDTFSRAYAFLLTQADVDAVTVNSDFSGAQVDHYWVAIILDSKWYYADLSLDLGRGTFTHFGMSDTEMTDLGYKNAENDAISAYTGNSIKDLIDTLDTRFHAFHSGAYSPVLDRDLDKVTFKDNSENEIVFDLIAKNS